MRRHLSFANVTATGTQINLNQLGKVPTAANADNAAALGGTPASGYVTVAQAALLLKPVPFTTRRVPRRNHLPHRRLS